MRISDWGSDVCSSDLRLNALRERHEIRPAMIAERDRGEDDLATAELAEVDDRAVARDVPGRLQPLRSGEARAWRQADPVRQVGVGDTAAALQQIGRAHV